MATRPRLPTGRDNTLSALRAAHERLTGLRVKHAAALQKAQARVEREQRAIARLDRQVALAEVAVANFGGDWSAWGRPARRDDEHRCVVVPAPGSP